MASGVYNRFKAGVMKKSYDMINDDIKVALLANTYNFNSDHNVFADVSSHEISGTGYTAGGVSLTNKTVTQNDTSDKGVFDADDVTWTNATITARYAVIYNNTLTNKDLVGVVDFGGDVSVTNGNLTIQWNANGILTAS